MPTPIQSTKDILKNLSLSYFNATDVVADAKIIAKAAIIYASMGKTETMTGSPDRLNEINAQVSSAITKLKENTNPNAKQEYPVLNTRSGMASKDVAALNDELDKIKQDLHDRISQIREKVISVFNDLNNPEVVNVDAKLNKAKTDLETVHQQILAFDESLSKFAKKASATEAELRDILKKAVTVAPELKLPTPGTAEPKPTVT